VIIDVFPTPVYRDELIITQSFDHIEFYQTDNSYQSCSNDVLSLYPQLKQQLQHHVDQYTQQLGYTSSLSITTSWLNKHHQFHYAQQHVHANSIVSGVLFITIPDDSGLFVISKQPNITHDLFTVHVKMDTNTITPYNTDTFNVVPQENILLLFPSSLPHSVTPNRSNQVRLTLAFNTFINSTVQEHTISELNASIATDSQ